MALLDEIICPPALPSGVRSLKADEAKRLKALDPSLPSSPRQCITCQGTKTYRWYDADHRVVDYQCNCEDQFKLHRYLLHSGVGLAYQRLGWLDAGAAEADLIAAVTDWGTNSDRYVAQGVNLVLTGTKGSGKTLLAQLLVKMLAAQGKDCYAVTFGEMVSTLISSWRDPEERVWFHARIRNAGVLLIDDPGRELHQRGGDTQETARFAFEEVMRHRIGSSKPTIVTSNLSLVELGQHYGSNLFSLLGERAMEYRCIGADFRPQANARFRDEMAQGLTRPVMIG